ncbi:HEAT repeat domain-containing protein [Nostoc sp. FACHB-152]|uniref:HEAT repeat domain-containing protein n=1 Tax=unclassified Nostoc TaxID=2593658 RepID=UPI0016843B4A|nr:MULTISPECIES: HEAT repeat domain-containing protein [unclassified Nostoc]MBD2445995.1 HEAT repeat domain-containing protein [Nostoc sp. FACHB-152]MBD2467226.1 HEAT repeat domain-containing protein [Nostoc sp. FACHB-145]
MIFEWVATWIATKTAGFLVKTIINEEFVKDFVKDYTKDFFKNTFNIALTERFKQEPLQKAAVMAVTEYLELMQQDLDDSELPEDEIKKYTPRLKQFLKNSQVKEILGNAFQNDCQTVDTKRLEEIWYELNSSYPLPDDFNWKRVGKKYVQKVKNIIHELPELRETFDSKNLEQTKGYTKEIAGIIPEFDLQQYQESIRERYGNLKLDSLDTSGYAYNELKLWRMFIAQNVREVHQVLHQVHELPKEHLKRLRESDQIEAEIQAEELERYKRVYLEQPIRSVLDVVNDKTTYKYIVILGDPGSGKSTLLQYLTLNWAESPVDNVISLPIPLLIELRTYMRRREDKECHNFLEFFHKCSGVVTHLNQHKIHEQLKAGNAVVMFDGLDEVFDHGKREDVITDIHRFTNDYPNVQVIVTSRKIGYKMQRLRDAEFHHFELQDLDSEQIQNFIHRWHELTFSDEADKIRKRERLQRGIENSKAITELAGNPLLLTMMAILNRNQELPRDRVTLYEQASRVLLHQWDVEAKLLRFSDIDPYTIDLKDKQAMLRQVAYKMQAAETGLAGNLISKDELEETLISYLRERRVTSEIKIARLLIEQLRERNFILCFLGADYYAFVHRTFLEYFCAWEFVKQFEKRGTANGLTIEAIKTDVFGKHWQDEKWHEVLLLIAGMIEEEFVGDIIDYLMSLDGEEEKFINLFLAAKCLTEVRNCSVIKSVDKLLNRLKNLTQYDLWYYYDSGRNHKETQLVREIRTQAVIAITSTWQDSAKTLLRQWATANKDSDVRDTAVEQLAQVYKDDPDTKTLLRQLASADEDSYVRWTAVEQLAQVYKEDPDTKTLLRELASADKDSYVRQTAVQQLAQVYKDDPDTKTLLHERVSADKDSVVQMIAVRQLAQAYKDDPDTKTLLCQLVSADKDSIVQATAVRQLAQAYKDDPDTKTLLCQLASADKDSIVQMTAVRQLAQAYKDDPDTKTFLQELVNADKNSYVRRTAVQQLAQVYKEDPDTKTLLRQLASADKDSVVQQTAVEQLAQVYKEDPDTKTLLHQLASADEDSVVQATAVQQLAQVYKEDPDTKTLLRQLASADEDSDVRGTAVQQLAQVYKYQSELFDVYYNCAKDDLFEGKHESYNPNPRRVALEIIFKQFPQHPKTLPLLRDRAENDPDEQVREYAQKQLKRWQG